MINQPEIMATYQTILELYFLKSLIIGIMFNLWINLLIHLLRKHFCLCFLFTNQVKTMWYIYTNEYSSATKRMK